MAGFLDEVESGDHLRALVALRRKLAHAIAEGPEPKDLAALALRLERVLDAIEQIGGATTDEEHDDLAAKRRAKLSAARVPSAGEGGR